jgi:hypothetical protein
MLTPRKRAVAWLADILPHLFVLVFAGAAAATSFCNEPGTHATGRRDDNSQLWGRAARPQPRSAAHVLGTGALRRSSRSPNADADAALPPPSDHFGAFPSDDSDDCSERPAPPPPPFDMPGSGPSLHHHTQHNAQSQRQRARAMPRTKVRNRRPLQGRT